MLCHLKALEKCFEERDNLIIKFVRKSQGPIIAKVILKNIKEGTASTRHQDLF